jgi:hypothetical protein
VESIARPGKFIAEGKLLCFLRPDGFAIDTVKVSMLGIVLGIIIRKSAVLILFRDSSAMIMRGKPLIG